MPSSVGRSPLLTPPPAGPTSLDKPKPKPPDPLDGFLPAVQSPFDSFLQGAQRRSLYTPAQSLLVPTDASKSATVPNVPVPGADAQPTATQAFVTAAATQLGFSPQVSAIATTELARRLGGDLVIDLDTKKQLLTADDLAKKAGGGSTMPYTFDSNALAVLKDANTAASLGMGSLDELYSQQAKTLLPKLRDAAINGTDLDLDNELKQVNDPKLRTALSAYYDTMRVTRSVGQGDADALTRLPFAQKELDAALKDLPANGPLNAQVQAMRDEASAAQKILLNGADPNGRVPPAAVALMNNLARNPLGKAPDDDNAVSTSIENAVQAAKDKGATPAQAAGLQDALDTAYGLSTQGGSSPERLAQNKAKLADAVKRAGPFAAPLKDRFDAVSKQAQVKSTASGETPVAEGPELKSAAEQAASAADLLKNAMRAANVKGGPDAIEALQNACDSIAKGDTADGTLAGMKAAPSVVAALVELSEKNPGMTEPALQLLKKFSSVVRTPFDVVGAFGNAKKVISGTDLSGKPVSQSERANAAVDLVMSDAPAVVQSVATIAGASTVAELASAAAPPLGIAMIQAKLAIYTLQAAADMKTAIQTNQLRQRFHLGNGDDAQFSAAMDKQLKQVEDAPTDRKDQATETMRKLLTDQFPDADTQARFRAYASSKLGRQTVQAILAGKRIPGFVDPNEPDPTYKEGAQTIAAANQLKQAAAEFYKLEANEVHKQLNREFTGRSGESYMTSRSQQTELNYWLHRGP
jgi:hypothetical protein